MKMTEKQFEIAKFLHGRDGKGASAAKEVLVNGLSQSEAARLYDVSRQMVFSSSERIVENYLKALRIKEAFEKATAAGSEPTALEKYDIQLLVAINTARKSKVRKAIYDVMVLGVTPKEAAKTYGIYANGVHTAIRQANERYLKAVEVKRMFDDILENQGGS